MNQTAQNSADSVILCVDGVSKSFPGVQALDNVCFELRRGEVHVLLGENGAGKSTLIKILSGIYQPDHGVIRLGDEVVVISNPYEAQRLGIAAIHQEVVLVPHLTVAENIFLGQIPRLPDAPVFLDLREMRRRAQHILSQLGVEIDARQVVRELTTAQKKLVEIARALCWNARILIMDEPTAALSAAEVDRLFAIIRRLQSEGVSIIYISHRLEEVRRLADRVTVLRDGRYVGTVLAANTSEGELVRMMVGRALAEVFPVRSHNVGDEVLRTERLTRLGSFTDVSITVRAGEVVGLAGLVGSGRTEFVHAVFGAMRYDSGRIWLDRMAVSFRSARDAIVAGVYLLTSDRKGQGLILMSPLSHNVTLSALRRLTALGVLSLRREREVTHEYIGQLAIRTSGLTVLVKYLSGGNQQKVLLARALYSNARVFLLDEPTFGVDVGARVEIYRLLSGLADQGTAILVVSSDFGELVGLCDRIVVMRQGRVVREFPRHDVTKEAVLAHAAGGLGVE